MSNLDKTMTIDSRRVEAGIFYAFFSALSPVLILLWNAFANQTPSITDTVQEGVNYAIVAFIVVLWAAGIVSCVSDIARVYSRPARYGLFVLLVSPVVWAVYFLHMLITYINETFNSAFQGLL